MVDAPPSSLDAFDHQHGDEVEVEFSAQVHQEGLLLQFELFEVAGLPLLVYFATSERVADQDGSGLDFAGPVDAVAQLQHAGSALHKRFLLDESLEVLLAFAQQEGLVLLLDLLEQGHGELEVVPGQLPHGSFPAAQLRPHIPGFVYRTHQMRRF